MLEILANPKLIARWNRHDFPTKRCGFRSAICFVLFLLAGLASLTLTACTVTPTPAVTTDASPSMTLLHQSGIFSVYGEQSETDAARDIIEALQTHAPQVLRDLDVDYQDPVTIELFLSQEALDRDGMNPDMQGYYAYSGDHRIQMVSPRNPLPNLDLPYAQRVQIAVHEFVHLVNNAINPDLPTWLNEGVATYIGPHDVYTYVCQHSFPFEQIPALTDLEQTYGTVPAADLFAYSAVDFIASAYGLERLNQLIRQPGAFEEILGTSRGDFEQQWHEYMKANYTSSR